MNAAKQTHFPCAQCENGSGPVLCTGCGEQRCEQHFLLEVKEGSIGQPHRETFMVRGPLLGIHQQAIPGMMPIETPVFGPDEVRTRAVTVQVPVLLGTTHDAQSANFPIPAALGTPSFSDEGRRASVKAWTAPRNQCIRCREQAGERAAHQAMQIEEQRRQERRRKEQEEAQRRKVEEERKKREGKRQEREEQVLARKPPEPQYRRQIATTEWDATGYVRAFLGYAVAVGILVSVAMAIAHWFTTGDAPSRGPLGTDNDEYFRLVLTISAWAGAAGLVLRARAAWARESRRARRFHNEHSTWRGHHDSWASELAAVRARHADERAKENPPMNARRTGHASVEDPPGARPHFPYLNVRRIVVGLVVGLVCVPLLLFGGGAFLDRYSHDLDREIQKSTQ